MAVVWLVSNILQYQDLENQFFTRCGYADQHHAWNQWRQAYLKKQSVRKQKAVQVMVLSCAGAVGLASGAGLPLEGGVGWLGVLTRVVRVKHSLRNVNQPFTTSKLNHVMKSDAQRSIAETWILKAHRENGCRSPENMVQAVPPILFWTCTMLRELHNSTQANHMLHSYNLKCILVCANEPLLSFIIGSYTILGCMTPHSTTFKLLACPRLRFSGHCKFVGFDNNNFRINDPTRSKSMDIEIDIQ